VADSRNDATQQYVERSLHGPCFVCAILEGTPGYPHHDVYEDDDVIAFFVRRPTMLGHTIVAPKRHVESWVEDLTESEFLTFQRHVRRIAVAISAEVPTERMYSLSLGSAQGNAHLHWHLAPLAPGVPYEHQQFHALSADAGVLDIDEESQSRLASRIRRLLQ